MPKAPVQAIGLAKLRDGVRPAALRPENGRHRVPTMTAEQTRRTMVAGDNEYVRVKGTDLGDLRIQALDHFHFRWKVSIFAGAVGVLVVQEEEVVLVPQAPQGLDLVGKSRTGV